MFFDYLCHHCKKVFTIDKSIIAPHPNICILCGKKNKVERFYSPDSIPSVTYADRPIWTYNDVLKYKTCTYHDGPVTPVDKNKHGDITAWNDGPLKKKGKKK